MTHRVVLGDGTERTVQGRGRVILDRAGHPVRMVGTAQDITERERVEQVRENILSAVSHELRTPLTAILGFAITLRERWPTLTDEGREEMIGLVATQAARLERLLNDLLDVDRLRHGRLRVEFEHADLAELVRGVVAGRHDTRTIGVQAESVFASVDPAKFERIVDNLLANAERHTPAGSPIEVSVAPNGTGALLRVDDRGPGVPDDREGGDLPGLHARERSRGDRSRRRARARRAVRGAARRAGLGGGQPGRRRVLPGSLPGRRGLSELRCRGWEQEGALRCLLNNLDPAVAEDPEALVVYGGRGKAARSPDALAGIVSALERLGADETLIVQSGKAVAVLPTHEDAPRVLISTAMVVPEWSDAGHLPPPRGRRPDHVRPDDRGRLVLHRHAGHPRLHLRDLPRGRAPSTSAARSPDGACSPPGWAAWAARRASASA